MTVPQSQFDKDVALLRVASERLDKLDRDSLELREQVHARRRGYFTPQEEERVRDVIIQYRDCRETLFDLIDRYMDYADFGDAAERLRVLLVAYAAALKLYEKALKMIDRYDRVPIIKRKLNEPDTKAGITSGFYDEIYCSFSSPYNYFRLARAGQYFRKHRRAIHRLETEDSVCAWLCRQIKIERHQVHTLFHQINLARLARLRRWFARVSMALFRCGRSTAQALLFSLLARLRMPGKHPSIGPDELAMLSSLLQPGDLLLVRADCKLTSMVLPGFWTHTAIYLGNQRLLEPLGIAVHPYVAPHWPKLVESGDSVCVIEARPPAAMISTLARCLYADHVLAVRPALSQEEIRSSLCEAFGHLKKGYDFSFDFRASSRIVCTELIYRIFDGKGPISVPLVRFLGRFTLTCDQLADYVLHARADGKSVFEPIALFLKPHNREGYWIRKEEIVGVANDIRAHIKSARAVSIQ
jgi:hypothetical protein